MVAVNRRLQKGEALKVEGRRGMQVQVAYGHVWLTQHRDRNDYLLRAGESLEIRNPGPIVAYGLIDSALRFDTPLRARGMLSELVARFA